MSFRSRDPNKNIYSLLRHMLKYFAGSHSENSIWSYNNFNKDMLSFVVLQILKAEREMYYMMFLMHRHPRIQCKVLSLTTFILQKLYFHGDLGIRNPNLCLRTGLQHWPYLVTPRKNFISSKFCCHSCHMCTNVRHSILSVV